MDPMKYLRNKSAAAPFAVLAFAVLNFVSAAPVSAAVNLFGQVLGGGAPIANSTVTLFAASAGAPRQLAQTTTRADGRFGVSVPDTHANASLYLIAKGGTPTANRAGGDNPAIALLTVLGGTPPNKRRDQRDDDGSLGVDARAVPRRRRAQGTRARAEDCRRQRAQLR